MLILVGVGGTPSPAHLHMEAFHCSTGVHEGLPVLIHVLNWGLGTIQQLLFFSASERQEIFLESCSSAVLAATEILYAPNYFIYLSLTLARYLGLPRRRQNLSNTVHSLPSLSAGGARLPVISINPRPHITGTTVNILLTHPPTQPTYRTLPKLLFHFPFVPLLSFSHFSFHYLFLTRGYSSSNDMELTAPSLKKEEGGEETNQERKGSGASFFFFVSLSLFFWIASLLVIRLIGSIIRAPPTAPAGMNRNESMTQVLLLK